MIVIAKDTRDYEDYDSESAIRADIFIAADIVILLTEGGFIIEKTPSGKVRH
jgi:hypothetical protein